jgi:hypothetical protein
VGDGSPEIGAKMQAMSEPQATTPPAGAAEPRQPDFKGYLVWYVLLTCCIAVGLIVTASVYGLGMVVAGLATPEEIEAQLTMWDNPSRAVTAVIFIVLAVTVASRHGVTFGPGFGGYILGNILTNIAVSPLIYSTEPIAEALPYPSNLLAMIGLMLLYVVSLTAIIVALRRRARRLGSERAIIARFD